jgi:hypothetical protein
MLSKLKLLEMCICTYFINGHTDDDETTPRRLGSSVAIAAEIREEMIAKVESFMMLLVGVVFS